ncbi:MAG TPA: uracil-DNA glycosylase family protein [Gaiellaceae bacterium]|nr:uracil-DNA glycosylase family protein [Gaiellaceae bacterium]
MESAVPDVLAPGLRVVFCGINPGRVSAAAAAHFANPRNDFWRLLHDAGFTPRLMRPDEQFEVVGHGIGLTNAALRTTKGSSDLRSADFDGSAERLERIARELGPRAIAFVGKEAYRGAFRERPELGAQQRSLVDTGLFVLPSTSPANAAVPYAERLRWFRALKDWLDLEPQPRRAVRALVVDERDRVLLLRWQRPLGSVFWITPGGGVETRENEQAALCRELREEAGLLDPEIGPLLWAGEFLIPLRRGWFRQRENVYLVRVRASEVAVPDLVDEHVSAHRWWTLRELERSDELFGPVDLPSRARDAVSRSSGS